MGAKYVPVLATYQDFNNEQIIIQAMRSLYRRQSRSQLILCLGDKGDNQSFPLAPTARTRLIPVCK